MVWGRRRVGKTRLLLEWVQQTGGVYWMADESAAPVQRRAFAETLELRLPGFGQVEYRDWRSLLQRLTQDAASRGFRGPVVIDELPNAVRVSPELPGLLQHFVDHELPRTGLALAVAGSSQRMMQGLVLDANAPLFGRAREAMALRAIPAGYLSAALGLPEPTASVEAWACWGGVPRYWELAAPFTDLRDAVHALVLDPLGPLFDEPARLLLEEQPPATALRPLLDAIGAGCHRVSEIGGRIGQPATSLARPLTRLQELDLVIRETPFGEPPRSTKRALYKLADPFLRLWFQVVGPRRSVLMQVPRQARLSLLDAALPRLTAFAWEELCRAAVPYLADTLGEQYGPAQRYWQGSGPEWDLVATSLDGRSLLLGEVKWSLSLDPSEVARDLRRNGLPPGLDRPGVRVQRAVFIPDARGRRAGDAIVVDASQVLGALR